MKIPSEIQETLDYKFKKYVLIYFWKKDDISYLCIYSKKRFYSCWCHTNYVYPCSSIFIKIDKVVTLAEFKKEMKKPAKELKV